MHQRIFELSDFSEFPVTIVVCISLVTPERSAVVGGRASVNK